MKRQRGKLMWGYQWDFGKEFETPEARQQEELYRDTLAWLWRITQLVGDGDGVDWAADRIGVNAEIADDLGRAIDALTRLRSRIVGES